MSAFEAGSEDMCILCGEEVHRGDLVVLYDDSFVHALCEEELT